MSKHSMRGRALLAVVMAASVTPVGLPSAAVAAAALTLSPASAAPGTQITATGTGFPTFGGNQIRITIGQSVVATVPYQPPNFTATFAVPNLASGFHTVTACVANTGVCSSAPGTSASAQLRIVAPLPPPPPPRTTPPALPGDLQITLDPLCCDPPGPQTPVDLAGPPSPPPGPQIQNPGPEPDFPDLYVFGIELNQNIQDVFSKMPLVAGRKTLVRVHPRANVGNWGPIDGAILVKHSGKQEILYPVNGPVFTGFGVDRTDPDSSLNFVLEPKWYAEGKLEISALVWAYGSSTLDDKEPNPENNLMKRTVTFHKAKKPNLHLVPLDDGNGPGPSPTLGWTVFSSLYFSNDIIRSHPIADTNLKIYPIPLGPPPGNGGIAGAPINTWDLTTGFGRGQPLQRLFWYHQVVGLPDNERLYGLFHDSIPGGGYAGWALTQYKSAWAKPSGHTPSHEAGHLTGLGHVDCTGGEEKGGGLDKSHPNAAPNCSLAPISTAGYFGMTVYEDDPFTIYSNDPSHPKAAFPLMSYASPKWNDAYHWCKMLKFYEVPCDYEAIGVPPKPIPNPTNIDVDCDEPVLGPGGIELMKCLTGNGVVPAKPTAWLLVTGVAGKNGGTITQTAIVDKVAPALLEFATLKTGGTNEILVQDTAGATLARVPVETGHASGHGEGGTETATGEFARVIPIAGEVGKIELIGGGKSFAVKQISQRPPVVANLTAEPGDDGVRVKWDASDPDGDAVTANVLWSADGTSWLPVALDTAATSVLVGSGVGLPGGAAVRVKVVASDGVRTAEAISAPFSLQGKAPVVAIGELPDGSTVARYHLGDLTALGYDAEDGQLAGDAIAWSSNLDGDLGTGTVLGLRKLSAGEHTITATATDSSGASGTDTLRLIVKDTGAPAPRFQGAIPDVERRLLAGMAVPSEFSWLWIGLGAGAAAAAITGVVLAIRRRRLLA